MPDVVLTELQREVLRIFFALPEADGFVLAGGAALVASGLSERPTHDVDLFGTDLNVGITSAADALEAACIGRSWTVDRIQDSATFRRVVVRSAHHELLIDLAIDSPPMGALVITAYGPTYSPEELAVRKLLALFDRAAARDFVDMHALSAGFDLDRLVDLAAQLDDGFDPVVLVEMLGSLSRYTDDELADLGAEPMTLRAFIDRWRDRLSKP